MRRRRLRGAWFAAALVPVAMAAACRFTDGLTGGPPEDAGIPWSSECDADSECRDDEHSLGACVQGRCVVACTSPEYGNCDDAGANGCEVNLRDASAHCGRCGHDCVGGACLNGACQRVTLMTGVHAPVHIVLDDASVYGVNEFGTVVRVPKTDWDASVVLVQGDHSPQEPPPRIAHAGGTLYYTEFGAPMIDGGTNGSVWQVSTTDGGTKTRMIAANAPFAVSAVTSPTGTYVYWSEGNPYVAAPTGAIARCRTPSCVKEPIVDVGPGAITSIAAGVDVERKSVFWANRGAPSTPDAGTVERFNANVGREVLVDSRSGTGPLALVAGNGLLYFTMTGEYERNAGLVWFCDADGCTRQPTLIAPFQQDPRFLALIGNVVYWTNGDGSIKGRSVSPPGGEAILYRVYGARMWDIAVDAKAIYWTEHPGAGLYKLAR